MADKTEGYAMDRIVSRSASGSVEQIEPDAATRSKHDNDVRDLARWGKKQQLKRNFGLLSTISLTCTLMITWEGILASFAGGLTNGGPAGLVYAFLFAWFGNIMQALVMAELASMMPLAGGQYNWVAILSPPSCSKFLSYMTGYITWISWLAALTYISFLGGTMIQGLLILNHPTTYVPQLWHGTLILYAVVFFAIFINTVLIRILPTIESLIFVIHVIGFFAIVIPLVYFAPHRSAAEVFTVFENGGGWSTMTLSWFVGLSPTMPVFGGLDAASHIAEEIQNASTVIPQSMLASMAINGTMGFAMVLAVLFCLGDLESVLGTPTKFPYIQIFFDSTQSVSGATAMASVAIAAFLFAAIGALTTTGRMTWAFSRERGIPGYQLWSRIDQRTQSPLYAIGLSAFVSCVLGLINIGSDVAFYALTSLVVAGFYTAFTISASVLLYRRLKGDPLNYGPFKLGRFEIPVIIVSLIYSIIGIIFSFFPPVPSPDLRTMNWAVVVFFGAIIFSLLFWVFHGRKVYEGPIIEVVLEEDSSQWSQRDPERSRT